MSANVIPVTHAPETINQLHFQCWRQFSTPVFRTIYVYNFRAPKIHMAESEVDDEFVICNENCNKKENALKRKQLSSTNHKSTSQSRARHFLLAWNRTVPILGAGIWYQTNPYMHGTCTTNRRRKMESISGACVLGITNVYCSSTHENLALLKPAIATPRRRIAFSVGGATVCCTGIHVHILTSSCDTLNADVNLAV